MGENGRCLFCLQTWIAYVGPFVEGMTDDSTTLFDAKGKYIAPGLLDGHCHIENGD